MRLITVKCSSPKIAKNGFRKYINESVMLQPEFLAAVNHRQFLVRMLTNLKYIYLKQQDIEKALAAVERILLLLPDTLLEMRDRGLLYYQLGLYTQATQDLQSYLTRVPDADDAPVIRRLLTQMGSG